MRLAGTLIMLIVGVASAAGSTAYTVTITAEPSIARWPTGTSLEGRVSNGKAGQLVTVDAKACPSRSFVPTATVRTTAGGAWSTAAGVAAKTVFRARWKKSLSHETTVLMRPRVLLGQMAARRFRLVLSLGNEANGKRLLFERFDLEDREWRVVREVVFRATNSEGRLAMIFSATVPKGTPIRVSLPRAEAEPCYLAGYSNILTT